MIFEVEPRAAELAARIMLSAGPEKKCGLPPPNVRLKAVLPHDVKSKQLPFRVHMIMRLATVLHQDRQEREDSSVGDRFIC